MTTWKLKVLGCDNDAGEFERGGDICYPHKSMIQCSLLDLAERVSEVVGVRFGIADNVSTTMLREGLYIVSMTDGDMGQSIAVVAQAQ